MSVLREKASDVIEDFFLALRAWQHVNQVEATRILNLHHQIVKHFSERQLS